MIRRLVVVLTTIAGLAVPLVGCGPPMQWEKPGADQEAMARDQADCRVAAQQEANRNFYPAPIGPLYGSRWSWVWWQQSDSQRFYAESNLARFCMRNKGYELVPVPQAQTRTPPATPEK